MVLNSWENITFCDSAIIWMQHSPLTNYAFFLQLIARSQVRSIIQNLELFSGFLSQSLVNF